MDTLMKTQVCTAPKLLSGVLAIVLLVYTQLAYATEKIGIVEFARGAVSAQVPGESIRIVGKNSAVFEKDVITTGPISFAVIRLNDGTKLSVRPKTTLSLDDYDDGNGSESSKMHLFKGGLRAISGLISKRNPDAYKVKTHVATIGIRGTEFDARLCQDDCEIESKQLKQAQKTITSSVIARVVLKTGDVSAIDKSGDSRNLSRGAPIYLEDEIVTAAQSTVVIVFSDKGRMSLKANSRIKVEDYVYDLQNASGNTISVKLLKGGVRALTGLIGKDNPDAYKMQVPVATIGIRGTGYDLDWLGECVDTTECGLLALVWNGSIFINNNSGEYDFSEGNIFRIRSLNLAPEPQTTPPTFTVPRPDKVDVDFENLFGANQQSDIEPGLYVACYAGHCALTQDDRLLDLGAGEAGFASLDGQTLIRLEQIEPFQANDPYLRSINELFDTLYELLDDTVVAETEFECVVE